MRNPSTLQDSSVLSMLRGARRLQTAGVLALAATLGASGCNLFASFGAKARGTVNTLGKRNVDFDRLAPAEKDLASVHTVAIAKLDGRSQHGALISGHLTSLLSDSERFTLVSPDAAAAPTTTAPTSTLSSTGGGTETVETAEASETAQADPRIGMAMVKGSVIQAGYDERMDSKSAKCGDKTCTTRTRFGTAAVSVNLQLVDVVTGEILVQKTVEDRREAKTSATNAQPPSIDGQALLDEASRTVAGQFFATISPHVVQEQVFFETDGKAKSLKEGANRAMSGDLEGAIDAFEDGLAQAESKKDEKAIAKARFDLGLALVIAGRYDEGLKLMQASQRPKSKKAWGEILRAAKAWSGDAERASAQWKVRNGDVPAFEPSIRQSEKATAMGKGAVRALGATTGLLR